MKICDTLADLLQSGIEDINSLEKPYIFAEVGRMAAEESSFTENFLARSESSEYIGLFYFYFQVLRSLRLSRSAYPQSKIKNDFGIFYYN